MTSQTQILQRLGTIVGINIAIEQLQGTEADYKAIIHRKGTIKDDEHKEAIYGKNRVSEAIASCEDAKKAISKELKQLATGPEAEQFVTEMSEHNQSLFYKLINLDYGDQIKTAKYMDSIKRKNLKAA